MGLIIRFIPLCIKFLTAILVAINPQTKESVVSVLDPYIIPQVTGNRALLFLVNSIDEQSYAAFHLGVLPALNHFGIPFRIWDVGEDDNLPVGVLESAGLVLAHDSVAKALTSRQQDVLISAVNGGLGMVSFDGRLWDCPTAVNDLFGLSSLQECEIGSITSIEPQHYVTSMQESGLRQLRLPVTGSFTTTVAPGFSTVMADTEGRAVVVARDCRDATEGRRIALLFSPELWLRQHFGHGMGLDDLFWRSLVWIAKKPFPVMMMPPFAVCRIDDASGSHDNFGYAATLKEFGWKSNIGLFVDDIDDENTRAIKGYYDDGSAQFSAHSFHEIGEPLPDQIYLRHDGSEYSLTELKAHFEKMDAFFDRLGITPARVNNIHYDELGINALPFLAARKQFFTMDLIPYGVAWDANSYSWEPYPYGHQSLNYTPMAPDPRFWNVMGHYLSDYKTPDAWMSPGEFMYGNTIFGGENVKTDISAAIEAGSTAVKVAIASGFFGTLMCHEQRIAAVTSAEWRQIISGIADKLSQWPVIHRSYDEIAQFAKDKARTQIVKADYDETNGSLATSLEGTCEASISCHIFRDEGDGCVMELANIPAFDGKCTLAV